MMPRATQTHCPYCALQCGMQLVSRESLLNLEVAPRNFPTNKGGLCQKGWSAATLLSHPERLTMPLMRDTKGAPLHPVSWEEALTRITQKVQRLQQEMGNDAIGVFGGGGLTNEKVYLLGKFARVALGTRQIDYNGRFCMSSAAAAGNQAFGLDRGMPFPLEDIPKADTLLLIGANPAETMPPLMQYFDAQRERGGALIVADPRRTATAQSATLHLQLTPGTDTALLLGLLHLILAEGWADHDYIAARTIGFAEVQRTVAAYWPERVERITGIPTSRLQEAARLLGEAPTAMTLMARGAEQQSKGVDNALASINLMLALGQVGTMGGGWGTITGQGNGQGGREHGQKADQLPGYQLLTNPQARERIAALWGVTPESLPQPGLSAYELLDALGTETGPNALLVFGSNLVVSAPRSSHIEAKLKSLDLLVVADFFLSETAQLADIVLPVAQWAEETGTMTNLEGRVLLRQRAQLPPEGVKTDAEVLIALAERLGHAERFPTSEPEALFAELGQATSGAPADYSGITYAKIIRQEGVFWPCPSDDPEYSGTPRLFTENFAHPDGRARFHAIAHRTSAEEPDDAFPLYLTTGRVMQQYQSGTQTRRVASLNTTAGEGFVELHPSLARQFGIVNGQSVKVITRRGEAIVPARVTATIRPDTIFLPFHYAGHQRANLLTNPALDPTSKMPEFKVCAARIEPVFRLSES
nr:molybdopterin oxidoreductase family protein [Armatimonas sp.]